MPPIKEKWEVQFEAYRDTLISLGAKIKNEKALKQAFKIYGEKRLPARIYQSCVEETNAVPIKTASPIQTETVKKENASTTDRNAKPSAPQSGKKTTTLNSFDALANLKLDEAAAGHTEASPRAEDRQEKKPRKTQRERFAEYKNRLQEKGIIIKDENGLWEKFRSIRGRLDYSQISEFVTFPERKPRGNGSNGNRTETKNDKRNNQEQQGRRPETPKDNRLKATGGHNDNRSPNQQTDTVKEHHSAKTPFDEYRESLLAQGYEIINLNALARLYIKGNGFIAPEQLSGLVRKKEKLPQAVVSNTLVPVEKNKNLPVVIEDSFADKWIKPLKEHCQKDIDRNGHPKREVKAVKADQQSVIVDIVPSKTYAAENPQDSGARYHFEKTDNHGNVKVDMASKDGNPLDYEYFRMMMEANRKNGIKVIAFKDIQTDEFRDKLLAAALEFDMKVQGAPEKVNINAPYLKKLPNNIKIKLGIYNGDITPPKSAEQIKENLQSKRRQEAKKEPSKPNKPPLALPAHIPTRE